MPSPNQIMKFFEFAHLPEKLQAVSKPIGELAKQMDETIPDSAEKSAGLRKLLEAKDCLVRTVLTIAILLALTTTADAGPLYRLARARPHVAASVVQRFRSERPRLFHRHASHGHGDCNCASCPGRAQAACLVDPLTGKSVCPAK